MNISVATFNLNNLFSRFNFRASVETEPEVSAGGIRLTFGTDGIDVRSFMGRLVREKDATETQIVADRIINSVKADVIAVQEVEHLEILKEFNDEYLDGMYKNIALIEGNDTRLIDVGLMSKLPIGAITSHQACIHPSDTSRRVFGRDFVEVEILSEAGEYLFSVYNTHLKSHYVPWNEDQEEGKRRANERRKKQAEMIGHIINSRHGADAKFVLLGDMNDPPTSPYLAPMLDFRGGALVNGLTNVSETRAAKREAAGQGPGPSTLMWTHRFNPPGRDTPPEYELYDQIWLSPALAPHLREAFIDRRRKHSGDGSDHDPAWVVLDI